MVFSLTSVGLYWPRQLPMNSSRDLSFKAILQRSPICIRDTKLKNRSLVTTGRALNVMAAAALILLSTGASALGLGRVNVQSVLGEALRAEIEVTSLNAEEASSLRVSLASPEAFKASGVEYNAGAGRRHRHAVAPRRRPSGAGAVQRQGRAGAVHRRHRRLPVVHRPPDALVHAADRPAGPQHRRPAGHHGHRAGVRGAAAGAARAPAPAPAPQVALAPPPAPAPAPAPSRARPRRRRRPSHAGTEARARAQARTGRTGREGREPPAPAASGGESTVKVSPGDTLTSLAAGNKPSGVSLDQMLVSLYRNNP